MGRTPVSYNADLVRTVRRPMMSYPICFCHSRRGGAWAPRVQQCLHDGVAGPEFLELRLAPET